MYPDLSSARAMAIDIETKDPRLKTLGLECTEETDMSWAWE